MDPDTRLARLQEAFRRAFFSERVQVTPQTTSADIDGWDSLSHVRLLLEVERAFGIRLRGQEGTRLKDVGELLALIAEKQQS